MKKFAVSAAACMIASALYAQENTGFVLLPDNGAGIATTGSFDLSFSENGGSLNFGIFSPLREYDEKNAWLLYDVGVSASLDDDFSPNAYALYGGLVYRYQAQPNVVLGFNAYLEGAGSDANSDFMGLASVGAELDWRSLEKPYFLQAGANYYLPFDDYTNVAAYGVMGSAPRQGADAYVSLGRSYEAFDVRGSLAIFDYAETPTALGLNGYRADATIAFGGDDGGPETRLSLGVRDDSRLGVEPALVAGLTMEFQFGGTQDVLPQRDCAIVRDGSELPTIDCDEQVLVLAGDIENKDGTVNASPATVRPLVRVDRPQRHLGFETPFTPIEYSGASITLIKRTEGADNTFTFTSNATGLSTTITTSGGEGSAPAVEIEPGTYSITETALPAGYSLDAAACTGASVSLPISGGVEITVANGDRVVCTFNNGFTQPVPDPTLQIVKQTTGGDETFNFATDAPGLATSLTTSGGTATSPAVTVTPGTYAITEILTGLPDGWTFEEASCNGATFSNAANGVNVTLAAGDNAVCTFANEFVEQTGTLQIVKQTTGGDETFNFATDAPGLATELTTVSGEATSAAVTIAPGTYAITEVLTGLPDGWTFEEASCTGATFATAANGVNVTLAAGDAAVCTFDNAFVPVGPNPTIQLIKQTNGIDETFTFDTNIPGLATSITTAAGSAQSDEVTVSAGTYTITEDLSGLPNGWSLTSVNCTGTNASSITNGISLDLLAGETAVCTFENAFSQPAGVSFATIDKISDAVDPDLINIPGYGGCGYGQSELFRFTVTQYADVAGATVIQQDVYDYDESVRDETTCFASVKYEILPNALRVDISEENVSGPNAVYAFGNCSGTQIEGGEFPGLFYFSQGSPERITFSNTNGGNPVTTAFCDLENSGS